MRLLLAASADDSFALLNQKAIKTGRTQRISSIENPHLFSICRSSLLLTSSWLARLCSRSRRIRSGVDLRAECRESARGKRDVKKVFGGRARYSGEPGKAA